jgi:hypothetical protein
MKAYIFACNDETMGECLARNLFGVADNYVSDISPGDYCYLYNYSSKMLYGLWKATSRSGWLARDAWRGKYRFQVRVELVSKTLNAVPLFSVKRLIQIGGNYTWKLYGDKAQNLIQYFASKYSEEVLFGVQLKKIEEDYRLRYPAKFICEDGHRVRSLSEKTIDDWLFRNRIPHAYEPVVPVPEQLIPDFMVNTENGDCVYIEFWGMLDDPIYMERRKQKIEVYARHHFPLIELRLDDLQNLNFIFPRKLEKKNVAFWK